MKRLALCAMILGSLAAGPALAALADGTQAPDFTAQASMGGKEFTFSLSDALKKGPVVLYFYPAAFTSGCTVEAHDFADATDKFAALGATVIGVSHDKIETLDKFSVSECRSKFAVAADPDEYDHQILRCGSMAEARICEPHVLCDRAGRQDPHLLHVAQSGQARRERRWLPSRSGTTSTNKRARW